MKKLLLVFSLLLVACANDSYSDLMEKGDDSLVLRWNKAYADDDINKSLIGLKWALSYIGAKLPSDVSGVYSNGNRIYVDSKAIGLSENAQVLLNRLHQKIKNSQEYQQQQTIDLGRYVTLLLGASEHYYALTGVPEQLDVLMSHYTLQPEKGYVDNSGVSLEHRIIRFSEQNGLNQVFLSTEINPANGAVTEYETIELLDNGQLRFGIFDANGIRKNNADPTHSNAGKPAKCMWCHESSIQPLFTVQNNHNGFLPYTDFRDRLLDFRTSHNTLKNNLPMGVDFSQTQQHTLTELLYISFMEPSAERLSREWNLTLTEVQNRLAGLPTHTYDEFPFLGNLYHRKDIESLAPLQSLSVSDHVRELSQTEVNHLN